MNSREAQLQFRNALADYDHVASDLVAQGPGSTTAPVVTIAIPTYRRPELLLEAAQSASCQKFGRPFEILIVDNDPASRGAERLLAHLPDLQSHPFRYFVNRENIGMFGNWNRCVELARGEWLTILNDDDLLDHDCLDRMFAALDKNPQIEALTCRNRAFSHGGGAQAEGGSGTRRIAKWLLRESAFLGRDTRKITPRKFFWGSLFGNSAGFFCKRQIALAIGGFYPEEFPSADYGFYLRLSKTADFREYRGVVASIRTGESETGNPETVRKALLAFHRLQRTLVGSGVPRWWRAFAPMVVARDRADFKTYWGIDIPKKDLEQELDIRLPRHRPYLLLGLRLLLRGF